MTKLDAYLLLAAMVTLTVISQLLIKWHVSAAGSFPDGFGERVMFFVRVLSNPWVVAAFGSAFLAGICWIGAMTRIPLTIGYPFIGLTFPLVLIGGVVMFGEALSWQKILAIALILAGLTVQSQA